MTDPTDSERREAERLRKCYCQGGRYILLDCPHPLTTPEQPDREIAR